VHYICSYLLLLSPRYYYLIFPTSTRKSGSAVHLRKLWSTVIEKFYRGKNTRGDFFIVSLEGRISYGEKNTRALSLWRIFNL